MICREPFSVTYLIITALIFAFSGELFSVFFTKHERDCWRSNTELLEMQKEGPLMKCS